MNNICSRKCAQPSASVGSAKLPTETNIAAAAVLEVALSIGEVFRDSASFDESTSKTSNPQLRLMTRYDFKSDFDFVMKPGVDFALSVVLIFANVVANQARVEPLGPKALPSHNVRPSPTRDSAEDR